MRTFLLTVKLGAEDIHAPCRGRADSAEGAERVFELRDDCGRRTRLPRDRRRLAEDQERLSVALSALAPDGKAQIEWKEEKKARPLADKEEED